ncbi:helix-turn-helix transcriptional regulator [Microbacterium sp. 3J1]|uniref:ArsR/SmtB family transcription factor n=1 Tax=Microbacterium sp. 3J1 TaxID=861269 RepID=UPI000B05CA28|nr:metalloregulator ArsR/SmtB family transcription factor [Microbacterium sp. 3J1]
MAGPVDESASRQFWEPDVLEIQLVDVLKAIADPARLSILHGLADGEYHPCNVAEFGLPIHKSTLSHHFKTLREAGVTTTRVQGREAGVRLRFADLERRWPGLLPALLQAASSHTYAPAGRTPTA